MLQVFRKPEVLRQKVTTEFIFRTGDKIRPLWKRNWLGQTLEQITGFGLHFRPFGTWVPVLRSCNLVTNVGHAGANGKMSNQGSYGNFLTIAVGTGTAAA